MNKEMKPYFPKLIEYYTNYKKTHGDIPKVKALAEARISALKNCDDNCSICCVCYVCNSYKKA